MAKRYVMVCGVLVCALSLALVSGCRAFNSDYSASPEADLVANPPKQPDPPENKPASPSDANPSDNAQPPPDYSLDTTECKTPDGVTVGKNPEALLNNYGWTLPVDGEQVTVTAVKKGPHSATITIQKDLPNATSIVLSFVVKQTAVDKFSACNFSYTEGAGQTYQGITGHLMIDRVNAADEKAGGIIVNSGSFELAVTRTPTATQLQKVYLGAFLPTTNTVTSISLDSVYFVDNLIEDGSDQELGSKLPSFIPSN